MSMPNFASQGSSEVFRRSISSGSWSRSNGTSLTKIGTISSMIDSTTKMKITSTTSTATTRGILPPLAAINLSTIGVSA